MKVSKKQKSSATIDEDLRWESLRVPGAKEAMEMASQKASLGKSI